ncbi:MAG: c-type cytochrome [Fimbriimonadaceae bacterium]
MAVGSAKKNTQTGLQMNMVFFGMSVVVLVVMILTMWKDTHPAWMTYQDRFAKLELQVLTARRNDLLRQLNHPDYLADYNAAKAKYATAKDAADAASGVLEGTEADLEELELEISSANNQAEPATLTLASSKPAEPNASDMAELDKAAAASPGSKSAAAGAAPATAGSQISASDSAELDKAAGQQTPSQAGAGAKGSPSPSSSDMAELDKEAAKDNGKSGSPKPAGGGKGSASDMAELDKEAAKDNGKSGSTKPAGGGQGSASDMAELDKEIKTSGGPPPTASAAAATQASSNGAPAPSKPTFEEADFSINQASADAAVEGAERNVLEAERVHRREMIGLPQSADLERKHSDLKLSEAQHQLDVATASAELERRKAEVKAVAQVARWFTESQDIGKIAEKDRTPEQQKELATAVTKLADHQQDLERDLRLVDSRLDRNHQNVREIRQVYVQRLGAVDRCQTCHLGIDDPAFADAPQPFRTHPGAMLQAHAVEKYGCVSCHGGFGNSLNKDEAHGQIIGKGTELRAGVQVQASCGKCHGDSKDLSGAFTYLAGKELFKSSGCLGCHKVSELQSSVKAGPSLDSVGVKLSAPWLVKWLQNPQSHSVEARMPNLGLTLAESQAISAYLMTQHGSAPLPPPQPPPLVSPAAMISGKRLTESLGCLGCHTINGRGSNIGPELTNVRAKVRPDWLYAWLLDPRKYLVNSRMPNFNLTKAQAELIGNYLLALGLNQPPVTAPAPNLADMSLVRKGGELIAERGCAGCHDVKGFARLAAPDLSHVGDKTLDVLEFGDAKSVPHTTYDWLVNKVHDPSTFNSKAFTSRMPKFGLDMDEAKSIGVYLSSLVSDELPPEYLKGFGTPNAPLEAGRRLFADKDCGACHRISGEGGKIGPELTREGEMVQPGWLFKFLKRPTRIRWWQDARMPDFGLTDAEATTLTEYLMALSNQEAPYVYTPPGQLVFPLASAGKKYFAELKCQSCHPLAGKQAVSGGDVKKIGPDLGMAPKRLKAAWMLKFFIDPQAFTPGTQMPTFNKPEYEYKAIIDFLMKQ